MGNKNEAVIRTGGYQSRGLDIHCGCFSTETTEGPAGIWTVLRDVAFLAVSVYLTLHVFCFRRKVSKSSRSERE